MPHRTVSQRDRNNGGKGLQPKMKCTQPTSDLRQKWAPRTGRGHQLGSRRPVPQKRRTRESRPNPEQKNPRGDRAKKKRPDQIQFRRRPHPQNDFPPLSQSSPDDHIQSAVSHKLQAITFSPIERSLQLLNHCSTRSLSLSQNHRRSGCFHIP
jgi:hypothetical protein